MEKIYLIVLPIIFIIVIVYTFISTIWYEYGEDEHSTEKTRLKFIVLWVFSAIFAIVYPLFFTGIGIFSIVASIVFVGLVLYEKKIRNLLFFVSMSIILGRWLYKKQS